MKNYSFIQQNLIFQRQLNNLQRPFFKNSVFCRSDFSTSKNNKLSLLNKIQLSETTSFLGKVFLTMVIWYAQICIRKMPKNSKNNNELLPNHTYVKFFVWKKARYFTFFLYYSNRIFEFAEG